MKVQEGLSKTKKDAKIVSDRRVQKAKASGRLETMGIRKISDVRKGIRKRRSHRVLMERVREFGGFGGEKYENKWS